MVLNFNIEILILLLFYELYSNIIKAKNCTAHNWIYLKRLQDIWSPPPQIRIIGHCSPNSHMEVGPLFGNLVLVLHTMHSYDDNSIFGASYIRFCSHTIISASDCDKGIKRGIKEDLILYAFH